MAQKYNGTTYATRAYQELRLMGLSPRVFLPSIKFMAPLADRESLPEELWLNQVRESVYDTLREPKGPYWGAK